MTADALTVTPSKAELQVAYLKKLIYALSPVLLAGVIVISDAVQNGGGLTGVTWVTAALAVAQALGTFLPTNAVAKLIASLAVAIGAGIVAGVTDGSFSLGEILIITTQFLAWAAAGAAENGARPDIAEVAIARGLSR